MDDKKPMTDPKQDPFKKLQKSFESLPDWAKPIVAKHHERYSQAANEAGKRRAEIIAQFAKDAQKIVMEMFEEVKKEAEKRGYYFMAAKMKDLTHRAEQSSSAKPPKAQN